MKILGSALIRRTEEEAVQSGKTNMRDLMYRAGSAAARVILKRYDVKDKRVAVVCGVGNNGGDGCVVAGILAEHGASVTVVTPLGPPRADNARYYYDTLRFVICKNTVDLNDFDMIVDALFGIGLDRPLTGEASEWVEKMNTVQADKIAIDIPSGIHADTGKCMGTAFSADLTVTFLALKPCFVLPDGSEKAGEVVVAGIGIEPVEYDYLTTEEPIFAPRPVNSNKGTFGTGVSFCGSYGMAGAAILAAKAALRSGIGLLRAVLCDPIYPAFTTAVPEVVCLPVRPSSRGTFTPDMDFRHILSGATAVLFGCGCGNDENIKMTLPRLLSVVEVPVVIDADGINALAGRIDIIRGCKVPLILTPHPGEMARLTGRTVDEIQADRIKVSRDFAMQNRCIIVLKGAHTVIASPEGEIAVNMTGNPGMAKGGSGDVLSGIMLALLAQGKPPFEAAKAAVYLHGKAGDDAAAHRSERAMLPSDMIEEL